MSEFDNTNDFTDLNDNTNDTSNDLTVSNIPNTDTTETNYDNPSNDNTSNNPSNNQTFNDEAYDDETYNRDIPGVEKSDTTSSPSKIKGSNYSTGICSSPESCKSVAKKIGIALVVIFLIYIVITQRSAIANISDGLIKLFKYFVLYSMVFSVMAVFIKLLGTLHWWVILFYWCLERVIDPLKDNTVRYLYYYLTDYVNWIIYYPAMLYYLLFLIGLFMILSLIILPFVSFVGFLVGYIFSMMGEDPCNKGIFTRMLSAVTGAVKTFVPGASDAAKKGEQALKTAKVVANEAKEKAFAAAKTAKGMVPDRVKQTVSSKFGVNLNKVDPTKMAEDVFKKGKDLVQTADLKKVTDFVPKMPTADNLKKVTDYAKSVDLKQVTDLAQKLPPDLAKKMPTADNLKKVTDYAKSVDLKQVTDLASKIPKLGKPQDLASKIPNLGKPQNLISKVPNLGKAKELMSGLTPSSVTSLLQKAPRKIML